MVLFVVVFSEKSLFFLGSAKGYFFQGASKNFCGFREQGSEENHFRAVEKCHLSCRELRATPPSFTQRLQ